MNDINLKLKMKDLFLLEEAIMKNVGRPREDEASDYTVEKRLRASKAVEGNSQIGLILFVGLSKHFGVSKKAATIHIGLDPEGYDNKLSEYKKNMDSKPRFFFKDKLVKNYINIKQNQAKL